jgi:hypothetical protein
MLYGFRSRVLETKKIPNQGIRLTLRNGFLVAIAGGSIVNLPILLVGGTSFWLFSLSLAALISYYIFMWYAGIHVMRHYVLRFILILSGCTPRRYVAFLDYATNRIFLQKIGGGYYIFIHRLLLEYFASREATTKPLAVVGQETGQSVSSYHER